MDRDPILHRLLVNLDEVHDCRVFVVFLEDRTSLAARVRVPSEMKCWQFDRSLHALHAEIVHPLVESLKLKDFEGRQEFEERRPHSIRIDHIEAAPL